MKKFLALAVFLIIFSGCATKYQPYSFSGGYKDFQLSSDIFVIDFFGNAYSNMHTIQQYSLIRAAEVTKEKGFNYFIILTNQGINSVSARSFENEVSLSQKPSVNMTIKAFKEKPSTDSFFCADDIIRYIID